MISSSSIQRRNFLHTTAAWLALGGIEESAHAATKINPRRLNTNIAQMKGSILLNRQRLTTWQWLQTGDEIITGPRATLTFSLGDAAFHIRPNSFVVLGRGASINQVGALQLTRGGVVSAWGADSNAQIVTPQLTANIGSGKSHSGCGIYTEIISDSSGVHTYFCNCYGTVELVSGERRETINAQYHNAVWADIAPRGSSGITSAYTLNHNDQELEYLARLIKQRTMWQRTGKKIG